MLTATGNPLRGDKRGESNTSFVKIDEFCDRCVKCGNMVNRCVLTTERFYEWILNKKQWTRKRILFW